MRAIKIIVCKSIAMLSNELIMFKYVSQTAFIDCKNAFLGHNKRYLTNCKNYYFF